MKDMKENKVESESPEQHEAGAGRRKLLRSLAAGGGVAALGAATPDKWVKPAVQSVMLPAHATTSEGTFTGVTAADFLAAVDGNMLDFFMPAAYAGTLSMGDLCDGNPLPASGSPVCLLPTGANVEIRFDGASASGTIAALGGPGVSLTGSSGNTFLFQGSTTSGSIAVDCMMTNGMKASKSGGATFTSSYTTVQGPPCPL